MNTKIKNKIIRCLTNKTKHADNYATLVKQHRDLRKWRDTPHPQIGNVSTVKMSVLPKLRYRFNKTPIKIPLRFLCKYRQDYSIIYIEKQGN